MPGAFDSADASDLPVSWAATRDERPCDRCPADADRVLSLAVETALCQDCYERVVLGR